MCCCCCCWSGVVGVLFLLVVLLLLVVLHHLQQTTPPTTAQAPTPTANTNTHQPACKTFGMDRYFVLLLLLLEWCCWCVCSPCLLFPFRSHVGSGFVVFCKRCLVGTDIARHAFTLVGCRKTPSEPRPRRPSPCTSRLRRREPSMQERKRQG